MSQENADRHQSRTSSPNATGEGRGPRVELLPGEGTRTDGGNNAVSRTIHPSPTWEFSTDGRLRGTPAIDAAAVYIGSNDGVLYAIDRENGELVWDHQTDSVRIHSPTVVKDMVFAASGEAFFGLSAATGERRWQTEDRRIMIDPIVFDADAYGYAVDREGWRFHAIETNSGHRHWSINEGFDESTQLQSNISATSRTVATATWSSLRGFDRESGEPVWSVPHPESVESIDNNGTAFLVGTRASNATPNVLSVDHADGTVHWRTATNPGEWVTGINVAGDDVYATGIEAHGDGTKTRRVTALATNTGTVRWSVPIAERTTASVPPRPVALTEATLVATGSDVLTFIDRASGEVSHRFELPADSHGVPILSDGTLYVGSDDGTLYAYEDILS